MVCLVIPTFILSLEDRQRIHWKRLMQIAEQL